MFLYQELVNEFASILDDDTKSIVEEYSVFYTFKDYKIIVEILKERLNKIKYGLFDFICVNNFHFFVFQECNKELKNFDYLRGEIGLDEISELIQNKIEEQTKFNPKVSLFVNSLYYDPPYDFPTSIVAESQEYIRNILKDLNISEEEMNKFLSYLTQNLEDIIDNIEEFYDEYKRDFMNYCSFL